MSLPPRVSSVSSGSAFHEPARTTKSRGGESFSALVKGETRPIHDGTARPSDSFCENWHRLFSLGELTDAISNYLAPRAINRVRSPRKMARHRSLIQSSARLSVVIIQLNDEQRRRVWRLDREVSAINTGKHVDVASGNFGSYMDQFHNHRNFTRSFPSRHANNEQLASEQITAVTRQLILLSR